MDSITPFYLGRHEDGSWHVIKRDTGGPAEVQVDGIYRLLYRLPKADAEEWSKRLNEEAGMFSHTNPSR